MPFNLLWSRLFPAQKASAPPGQEGEFFVSGMSMEPTLPEGPGCGFRCGFRCFSFIPSPRSSCSHFLSGENRMSFISFSWLMLRDELILKSLHQEPKQLNNNSWQTQASVTARLTLCHAVPVSCTAYYQHLWRSGHRSVLSLKAGPAGKASELMPREDSPPQLSCSLAGLTLWGMFYQASAFTREIK